MSSVIHSEGLGKSYKRGLAVDRDLRHALDRFVKSPLSVFRRARDESFWALKDVSLQVKEGEVLGAMAPARLPSSKSSPASPSPPPAGPKFTAASAASLKSALASTPNSPAAKTLFSAAPFSA
jgi:hypothetical protein